MFAVQDGGMCMSEANAGMTFDTYGPSRDCPPGGKGGMLANQVYIIEGLIWTSFYFFCFC